MSAEANASEPPRDVGIYKYGAVDYYELLNADQDASEREIMNSFRDEVRRFHPDVSEETNAADRFMHANRAKEVLTDKEEKARYDDIGHAAYVSEEYGVDVTVDGEAAGSGQPTTSSGRSVKTEGVSDDAYDWSRTREKVLSNAPTLVWDRFRVTWIARATYFTVIALLGVGYVSGRVFLGIGLPTLFPGLSDPITVRNVIVFSGVVLMSIITVTGFLQMRRLNVGSPLYELGPDRRTAKVGYVSAFVALVLTFTAQVDPWPHAIRLLRVISPNETLWVSGLVVRGVELTGYINVTLLALLIITTLVGAFGITHNLSKTVWHDRYIRAKYIVPFFYESLAMVCLVTTIVGIFWGDVPVTWLPQASVLSSALGVSELSTGLVGILALVALSLLYVGYTARTTVSRERDMSTILTGTGS